MEREASAIMLHASSVSVAGHGVLIRGASGAGKSGLALQLIAMGGMLVADDRTLLWREQECLMMVAPGAIRGRIEARGVGILNAPTAGPQPLRLIVDMDGPAPPRLPETKTETLLGLTVALMNGSAAAHFPAAIYLYMLHGRFA